MKRHTMLMISMLVVVSALPIEAAAPTNNGNNEKSVVEKLEPNIGVSKESREVTGDLLNKLLGDFYLLYVKVQNYHWNVVGPMFNDLHLFFGKLYDQLADIVDKVAERIRALGIRAKGSLTEFLQEARLTEEPGVYPPALQMVRNLLNDYEVIIRAIRDDVENVKEMDLGTNTLLSDLIVCLEKKAWMLRSYLQ